MVNKSIVISQLIFISLSWHAKTQNAFVRIAPMTLVLVKTAKCVCANQKTLVAVVKSSF